MDNRSLFRYIKEFTEIYLSTSNKYDREAACLRLQLPFIPDQLYKILPYVVTVIVLVAVSMRKKRENQPPAALGSPYFREER